MENNKNIKCPLFWRIPIFIIGCPLTLLIMVLVIPIVSIGLILGIIWCFLEFLIYGDSKTDVEVTFGEKKDEQKDS